MDESAPPPKKTLVNQMSDQELAAEAVRSRMVGFISILTVATLAAFFFCLWLVQKDAASGGGDVNALLLIDDKKVWYILSYFFLAIGSLLLAPILGHIALAVRSRVPAAPAVLPIFTVLGPVLVALALPAFTLVQVSIAGDFAAGADQSAAEASRLLDGTAITITRYLFGFSMLILAIAWAMVGVFAMRAGLLTRLVGFVAVAIGLASVFAPPLAAIVEIFWVGAVSIMLLGRNMQRPPAWDLGRPVPWSEVAAKGESVRSEASEVDETDESS